MSVTFRFYLGAFLALCGSACVYLGALANVVALGGTWGDTFFLPGIALIGLAPVPVRDVMLQTWQAVLLRGLRCLSLPVFLLSIVTLAPALWSTLEAPGDEVYGVWDAAVLTASWLLAMVWPEAMRLVKHCLRTC